MKYVIFLVAASSMINFASVDVFFSQNNANDNLISCSRSTDQPPTDDTKDSSTI
jgi:hypothetical protein